MNAMSETPPGAVRLESNIGPALFVEGSSIARSVARHVEHDPGVAYFMRKHAAQLFPFFDVGANVGLFSIKAALMGGPDSVVFAFEPDLTNLELLRRNLADHGTKNVRIWPNAVTAADGPISLGVLDCGVSKKSKQAVQTFDGRSLASVIRESGVAPSFLKIDIEGAELDVLAGLEGARGADSTILELEFSWRDQAGRFDELLKARPIKRYRWEFLLPGVDTAPQNQLHPVQLRGDPYFRVAPPNAKELTEVVEGLARATEIQSSRKWELCISPRLR